MSEILEYHGNDANDCKRHCNAVFGATTPMGHAMLNMLSGWQKYGRAHAMRYDSPIGDDPVLGPAWAQIGLSLNALLTGELGGLSGGSINHNILAALDEQHFANDGINLTPCD